MLKDYKLPPLQGGSPKKLIIFLHGLGDRGDGGLLSIGQFWQRALPDCEFMCPDAPFEFDMAPPEFGGRQWFSLQTRDPETIRIGVEKAAPLLNDYIDHVLTSRKLSAEHLSLVGFSQGTRMALHVAPRRKEQLACVIGYSGFLTTGSTLKAEKQSSAPTLLVHGTADDVVPYGALAEAEKALKEADIPVTTVTCPGLGHSIDERGLEAGIKFLQQHLK